MLADLGFVKIYPTPTALGASTLVGASAFVAPAARVAEDVTKRAPQCSIPGDYMQEAAHSARYPFLCMRFGVFASVRITRRSKLAILGLDLPNLHSCALPLGSRGILALGVLARPSPVRSSRGEPPEAGNNLRAPPHAVAEAMGAGVASLC